MAGGMAGSSIASGLSQPSLLDRGLCPEILLGMPHLTPFGLSRTWLLKELAHRHWLMLGRHLGMDNADFRTPDGQEAYAAISALSCNVRFSQARANSVLSIEASLYPVSHARCESLFTLYVDGVAAGAVVLQSAFVARSSGTNRSVRRSLIRNAHVSGPVRSSRLAGAVGLLRTLDAAALHCRNETLFQPCPLEEFNGAGLFYFAEFLAVTGRAFWQWEGAEAAALRLERPHTVLFTGNIEQGETLSIRLCSGQDTEPVSLCTVGRMDGSIIASILFGDDAADAGQSRKPVSDPQKPS